MYKPQIIKGLAENVIGCAYKAQAGNKIVEIEQYCFKCHQPDEYPDECPRKPSQQTEMFAYWGA
jgi:hypothetical protein